MSPWQAEKQLAYLAAAQVYADSPGSRVLAATAISAKPARELVGELSSPFAVVTFVDGVTDRDQSERYTSATLSVEVAVENWSDPYGTGAAAGGSVESFGSSGGRGVDDVLGELRNLLGPFTDSTHGFAGWASATDRVETIDGVTWAFRKIVVTVTNASSARFYQPPRNVAGIAPGGGVASLSWTLPPDRFDRLTTVVRRSASGGSAPATVTDGTSVTLATSTTASATGLTPGTYAFSFFAAYDDLAATPTAAQHYSSPVSITLAVT